MGCTERIIKLPYSGHQKPYQLCHEMYDNDYPINVKKCEYTTEHPKYKRGQFVHLKEYSNNCKAAIVGISNYNYDKDKNMYNIRIKCPLSGLYYKMDVEESDLKK